MGVREVGGGAGGVRGCHKQGGFSGVAALDCQPCKPFSGK
jgi:hypothetical protein